MQGQKQIFMFIVLLITFLSFNFFKNAIKKEKEMKIIREDALRHKLELQSRHNEELERLEQITSKKHQEFLEKFLEYANICMDMHAILLRPEKITINYNEHKNDNQHNTLNHYEQSDIETRKSLVSGPIVYLFVFILICSLIKAATDISKQLRQKSSANKEERRCSLQEYANFKHEKRVSKAPFLRRSTTLSMETRQNPIKILDERRISHVIPEFNNGAGLITEPGTPAKSTNGIASRPAPLLRRCSVPAFAHQQIGTIGRIRRPSIDSFSEDDSSPDVKRRVRMIHRH